MRTSILGLLACLFITTANAEDKQTTERRTVTSFNGIHVCCGIDLYLTEGESSEIIVTAKPDEITSVITEVKNGVLSVSFKNSKKNSNFKRRNKVSVYVTAQNLISLEASAGGSIEGTSDIHAKDIRLTTSSGGDVQLRLDAENITCHASSGGDVKLKGAATTAHLSANSGGDLQLKDLTAGTVIADANSGGDIEIRVVEEITANASSGGGVKYYGNPAKKAVSSSSGGSVKNK
jgi:hypothetical protein